MQLYHPEPSPSSRPDLLPPFTVSGFPEDFGVRYCLPPSSHPAITLSYRREQEHPVRTLDSRPPPSPMHLGATPANRTTWTATTRLQGSISEMQTLLDDSHLSAQISLSPLTPGPTKTSIFSIGVCLLVCTMPSTSPRFTPPALTTLSRYQIPVAAATEYYKDGGSGQELILSWVRKQQPESRHPRATPP